MNTYITVAVTVLLFFMSVIMTLLSFIFHSWREEIRKETKALRQEQSLQGRHMTSMIHSIWNLTWRANSVEDFLADKSDFRPPRIIGEGEAFGKRPEGG